MKPSAMTKNWQLKTERKQQGWTQAKLANALGVTSRTVLRWEQGLSVPP
jgi:transcriptional regulator with XRE-family HTH domain